MRESEGAVNVCVCVWHWLRLPGGGYQGLHHLGAGRPRLVRTPTLQGYLFHKKQPPTKDHHTTLGKVLLQGPRMGMFLISEVPLEQVRAASWRGGARGGCHTGVPRS